MKTLYLECAMGAAGDMLMGALYELCPKKERFLAVMNSLLPGVSVKAEPVKRQGVAGTHMRVVIHGEEEGPGGAAHSHRADHGHDHPHDHEHNHDHAHDYDHSGGHHHHTPGEIAGLIDSFSLPEAVKDRAQAVYQRLAAAESRAHGVPVEAVHFHEVGALDAVMDVTGVCQLLAWLAPDRVLASPVTVGSGTVRTAHGLLPVPAPATAFLLEGVPVAAGDIAAELCTPTGAALLGIFAEGFGPLPAGTLLGCGHGCGTKDFPRANCLRAFLLEEAAATEGPNDAVTELKANIDDMTGEALGFAMEALLAAGALDVSYAPVQMKKNRPGVVLTCLCRPHEADRLAREILRHTATFGVRRADFARYALDVTMETADTPYGPIRRKTGRGYGVEKRKAEYEDCARAAREAGVLLRTVEEAARG